MANKDLTDKYSIKDNRDWKISEARERVRKDINENHIQRTNYRPFDSRWCYLDEGFMDYPRTEIFQHLNKFDNYALGIGRQGMAVGNIKWCLLTITQFAVDTNHFRRGGTNIFTLYFYDEKLRKPNLDFKFVKKFESGLNLQFLPDHDIVRLQEAIQLREQGTDAYSGWEIPDTILNSEFKIQNYFTPLDILDYIYAVLHSPKYRERYAEFLKTDFPRVPLPTDQDSFWKLVALGGELRDLHLMKHPVLEKSPVGYPAAGDNVITQKLTKTSPGWVPNISSSTSAPLGKGQVDNNVSSSAVENAKTGNVYINDTQYFTNVPKAAWEFYIGGYQPAQKWLKDRKGRALDMADVQHYRKIVKALLETERLMGEVDGVLQF